MIMKILKRWYWWLRGWRDKNPERFTCFEEFTFSDKWVKYYYRTWNRRLFVTKMRSYEGLNIGDCHVSLREKRKAEREINHKLRRVILRWIAIKLLKN